MNKIFTILIMFSTLLLARDEDPSVIKAALKEGMEIYTFKKVKGKLHIYSKNKKIQTIVFRGNGKELPLTNSVRIEYDFDQDGFLDMLLTEEINLGFSINSVYLFNFTTKKFELLENLSYMPNLSYNPKKQIFEETQSSKEGFVFYTRRYKLVNKKPVLLKEIRQEQLESEKYLHRVVKEKEENQLILKCEAIMKREPEFDMAYLITGDCETCELELSGIPACEIVLDKTSKPAKKKSKKKN